MYTTPAATALEGGIVTQEAAWERLGDLWRQDEARAHQYGHCSVAVSPKTSQAWSDALAAWVYASQVERTVKGSEVVRG